MGKDEIDSIVKELAPAIETLMKDHENMSASEMKSTMEALQKDIAEVKLLSKKSSGSDQTEARAKVAKFFRAAAKGNFEEVKTLSEGTAADGGYLVPAEFHKEVVRVAEISGFARKYCTTIPMSTDEKDVTNLATGAVAYVVGEGLAITASSPTFGQKILNARKFACLVKQTQELIEDNMSDEEVLTLVAKLCAEALNELEDAQVIKGAGTGLNMTWVLVDTNVNIVTMASGDTSFADVDYAYLVAVKNAVPAKYKKVGKRKAWVMSQDVFSHVESIVDTTGRPIMRESVTAPDTFTMLGYPVELNEAAPGDADDAVSTKFLAFGVWDYFFLGDRRTMTTEMGYSSGDFEKDIKSLKVTERVAGVNVIPAAFAVLKTAAA